MPADSTEGRSSASSKTRSTNLEDTFVAKDTAPVEKASSGKPVSGATRSIGDFELTRKLGQGGMGEVWLAKQTSLDRIAAVKLLAKHLAEKEDFVKRFYREAKAMAKVDHPQAVRVYAVAEAVDSADGVSKHYVAMEFVDGKSLQDWLDKLGKLSVADALFITLRCAEALEHAHKLQMIHRDIKPDNIMITNKGVVKVADFGLAKALDDQEFSMTQSGTGLGTPYYMAPEQARNAKHVDGRSDIYALGATLYHILTGKLPFTGESLIELIKAKETGRFESPRKLNKDVPEKLDLILGKMMAKDPEQRCKDCGEVIKMLSSLGVAGTSLSFIEAKDKVQVATGVPASTARPATAAKPAGAATASPAKSAAPAGADVIWFVQYHTKEGKDNVVKWPTAQIIQMLRSGAIDAKAKVKKQASESFVPIAQFSEFETIVQGLLVKQRADKKAGDMKAMYAKIDKQEKWHKTNKWLKGMFSSAVGFVGFLAYLGIIAAVLVGGYFAWQAYGGKVVDSVTKKPATAGENPQSGTPAAPK